MESSDFFAIWNKNKRIPADTQPCAIAAEFRVKIQDTILSPLSKLRDKVTRPHISQAKYMLQEEYHIWRKSIPTQHSREVYMTHQCVSDVYEDIYDKLHLMELTLRPLMNVLVDYVEQEHPADPIPEPPPHIDGIILGEEDG